MKSRDRSVAGRAGNLNFHRPYWEYDREISPEQRLWMAVIQLIFADGNEIIKRIKDLNSFRCTHRGSQRERHLTKSTRIGRLQSRLNALKADIESEQFNYICELANLDTDYVLKHLRYILDYEIRLLS